MSLRQNGKILYISSVDISLDNGPGINEREFIRVLSERYPNRIHFLIPKPVNHLDHNSDLFTFCHNTFKGRPLYSRAYHLLVHICSQLRKASLLIRRHKVNFLIFRLAPFPIVQAVITRLYHIPYAMKTVGWGALGSFSEKAGFIGRLCEPINKAITMDSVARATAIDACTQNLVDFYARTSGIRKLNIQLIENATNVEKFRPFPKFQARQRIGLGKFDPVIGYVGDRPWERGGHQMLEMSPELIRRFPHCGIVIVGDGEGMPGLMEFARQLGTEDHCVFPGRIDYDRVPDYINCFDVCISLDTPEFLAKKGNSSQKLRQYLACGKPVVSVSEGNSFVEDFELGSLVNPADLAQIQNAIFKWLMLTDEEREAFSRRARCYAVENLSIDKAVEERFDFWDRALKNRNIYE